MTDTTLENGLTVPTLAGSCQRVYCLCTRGMTSGKYDERELRDLAPDNGWLNVASVVAAYYAASDQQNETLNVYQLADQLRRSWWRGQFGNDAPTDFNSLTHRERLSWEMVARHAAGCVAADPDDIRGKLGSSELMWGDNLLEHARKRGVPLEQAIKA